MVNLFPLRARLVRMIPFRLRANTMHTRLILRYGRAAPKPYALINVPPDNIEWMCSPCLNGTVSAFGTKVMKGGWDRVDASPGPWVHNHGAIRKFDDYLFNIAVQEFFREGVPWEETEWYRLAVDGGISGQHYKNAESAKRRLAKLESLYADMQINGYKTQRQVGRPPDGYFPPEHYEVRVNIGRNGEFIRDDGRHRLAIAKVLGIPLIPVRVLVRHDEWQRKRVVFSRGRKPAGIDAQHPDLVDLDPPKWTRGA